MFLLKIFVSFFLIPQAYSKTQDTKKPLVLQWQVSHSRNTDQISLIFRQDTVELVTNTSSYQKGKKVRLGRFQSPMNPEWQELKKRIELLYVQLRKTVPISAIIKDSRVQPQVDPHAPILRINEEQIQREHPYFEPMADIIYQIWEKKWSCVECAIYTKKSQYIMRTVRTLNPDFKETAKSKKSPLKKSKGQWKVTKQRFAKKRLNCVPKGRNKIECIDWRFGIFEI